MPPSGKSHSSHSSSHHSSHSSHSSGSHRSYGGGYGGYGRNYGGGYYGGGGGRGGCGGCAGAILGPIIIVIIAVFAIMSGKFGNIKDKVEEVVSSGDTNRATTTRVQSDDGGRNGQNEIYVEAIDRSCPWDSRNEWYYDQQTDCYFWYNDEIDPPQWQYWYEGISSEYGDYGWMEYGDDGRWYIERSENSWIELPERFDTSDLWHIDD